jgi:cytochrome oxidase Cu insertion factor (SCO1/SenC/PrrC family)
MAGEMTQTDRALSWLGSRYFGLAAVGLVSFLTSLMLLALLMGSAAPSWAYPFLQICGFDPVKGTAPFGRVIALVAQAYLTMGVIAFFLGTELRELGRHLSLRVLLLSLVIWPLAVFSLGAGAGRIELAPAYAQPLVREGAPAPDFQLLDASGNVVRLSDFRGRAVIVTFFYSNCAEACPPLLARLKDTMARWEGKNLAVALAVTLDPERDTPQALARFGARLGLEDKSLRLLSGSRSELEGVWKAYGVEPKALSPGVVGHDVRVVLVDRGGRIAYTFYGLDYPERWLNNALELLVGEADRL